MHFVMSPLSLIFSCACLHTRIPTKLPIAEMARASGDVVLAAGERAKKINEKHHVVDKTKKAASTVVKNLKQFDEKHHVVEKTSKGVAKGLEFISEKLKPKPDDR
mmetsp:Transcript_741/g.1034  ORF Transcript_741/g.1034 Transcript_741/m.1034 type:complete len:105 (+) Transcript_741:330-644(+)